MPIIKNRQIVEDDWRTLADDADSDPGPGDIIVPYAYWQAHRDSLLKRNTRLGVKLAPDEGPELIKDDLAHFDVVALHFPTFRDGRHYSHARLLRERYGYTGELRATGDVLRDQIFFMQRCGFDAFAPNPEHDIEDVLAGFDDFSITYQPAADESRPLFRRRSA